MEEEKKISGEPLSGIVPAVYFSSWPKGLVSAVEHAHDISVTNLPGF